LVEEDESATGSVNLWSGPGNGAGSFLWSPRRVAQVREPDQTGQIGQTGQTGQTRRTGSCTGHKSVLRTNPPQGRLNPVDFGESSDETLTMEVLLDIRGMTVDILRILEDDDEEEEEDS
jgi:hypothetical protein